jgi:PAS domain S-box-containing protein
MKLTRAVEQSQATIVITDLEGRIEYANPAASRTTGYSFEELRGQNPRVLKGGNLPKEAYTALWETITRGETWSGEFLNKRKDGTLFWERAVISPVRDDEGRTIRYVAVKENITAQKEAEAELRDSRDFLDKILQSTANGIFVLDTEGRFSSVNDAAARITGRPREELLGRHFGFLIAEDFRPDCDNFFHDVVKNGLARRDFEVEILLPDGVRRPLSVSAAPLATNGLLVGLVGSAEDITDRQRAVEERFSSMEKEAMLGRLAAVVAHEVNNPLFAIKMQASSLARAIDGMEKESGRVKLILDQVDRIGRTVKALLGLARRHSTGFVELDLREMINSVLLLYEVGFVSKGIALDLDLPEDLPTVRAVPDRFQEVLVNLLENARQAIGANGRIGLRAIADEKEIELIIEDTGPGFGEKLDLIFKTRFTTKKEGTGLGLSIARRIVGEHGGTIVAENRAEGGARFRVRLPRFGG